MKTQRQPRPYRMAARADAAADTHRRILEAAIESLGARPFEEVSLAEIAHAAGVTVQTVLRRFGSKEGLGEAAARLGMEQVRVHRFAVAPGDLDGALSRLLEHYEQWGERSLLFLSQEQRVPAMRALVEDGRALHHAWVEHAFAPWLKSRRGAARLRLRAQLIAATDVYAWKIWRRDLALDPRTTATTLRALVDAALASTTP